MTELWSTKLGGPVASFHWEGHLDPVRVVLSGGTCLWLRPDSGALIRSLGLEVSGVSYARWHPFEEVAAVTHEAGCGIADFRRGAVPGLSAICAAQGSVSWSVCGRYLAGIGDSRPWVWSWRTGQVEEHGEDRDEDRGDARQLAWRPNSDAQLAVSCRNAVRILNLRDKRWNRATLPSGSQAIAWNRCGSRIAAACGDGAIRIWGDPGNADTAQLETLLWDCHASTLLAWDVSGRTLVASSGCAIGVWGLGGAGRNVIRKLAGHEGCNGIACFSFRRNGGVLAAGHDSGRVELLRPGKQENPVDSVTLPQPVSGLIWSENDKRLAVATAQSVTMLRVCR